jgi:hypothetical protein
MKKTLFLVLVIALAANGQKIDTEKSDRSKVIRVLLTVPGGMIAWSALSLVAFFRSKRRAAAATAKTGKSTRRWLSARPATNSSSRKIAETIYVALMMVTPPVFGQDTQVEEPKARSTVTAAPEEEPKVQSTSTEQTPNPGASAAPARQVPRAAPSPKGYGYRPTQKRPPAAQYSPLAAAGGYGHSGVTPWQAIVNYFNPHHLNMGRLFAERKQAWLDNALYNQYFWYSFWVTGLLILSWFAIAWIHHDRHRATWELAECASDALRYSEYCKREAKEAIHRHNDHIEKCNCIIEDNRSGLMTTPETARLEDLKRDIKRLAADNDALTSRLI